MFETKIKLLFSQWFTIRFKITVIILLFSYLAYVKNEMKDNVYSMNVYILSWRLDNASFLSQGDSELQCIQHQMTNIVQILSMCICVLHKWCIPLAYG